MPQDTEILIIEIILKTVLWGKKETNRNRFRLKT
jgi:hypothetical protein